MLWLCMLCGHSNTFQLRVTTALQLLKQYLYRCVSIACQCCDDVCGGVASRYQGYIGAYLVLGGVDITGPQLFTVHAHGSTDKLPYVAMGKIK